MLSPSAPPPAPSSAPSPGRSPAPSRLALYLDLIRWNRPAGWLLLLWPTLSALWLAAGGFPGWHLLVVFVLGTVLMRSAGCCVNDVADRDFDRHVKRTAQRPVTRGAVSVREALVLGALLALAAFALVLTTNAATIALSFAGLAITLAYPFAKRFVSMPQAVLGIAFSFGIPMAFAAVRGGADWSLAALAAAAPPLAWALLVANAFWVLAYDTEYAMVDRDDDLKIGMRTSAITLGRADVAAVMAFYAVHLLAWWWLARQAAVLGEALWFEAGLVAAAAQALWHFTLIRRRGRDGCFKAFRLNHWLGFALFVGLALQFAFAGPARAADAPAVTAATAEAKVENEMSRHWHARIAAWAAEAAPPAGAVVFLGDSMTERFALAEHFAAMTSRGLVNRGIGGDKVGGWRYWGLLDRIDETVIALRPRQVVLMIGVNDIVFAGTPPEVLNRGAGELLRRLAARVPRLVVHAVLPVRGRHAVHNARIAAFNVELRKAAVLHRAEWLDVTADFRDGEGELREELAADDIHLNDAGYRRWAERFGPRLVK